MDGRVLSHDTRESHVFVYAIFCKAGAKFWPDRELMNLDTTTKMFLRSK